jgi:hypothetical protein
MKPSAVPCSYARFDSHGARVISLLILRLGDANARNFGYRVRWLQFVGPRLQRSSLRP